MGRPISSRRPYLSSGPGALSIGRGGIPGYALGWLLGLGGGAADADILAGSLDGSAEADMWREWYV